MADFNASVIICEPIEEVFAYFADMANAPEYMNKVEATEKMTDKPIGVGTKYKEIRNVRGNKVYAEIEYLSYNKNNGFIRRSSSNGLTIDYAYRFSEIPEGTQVEFEGTVHVKGLKMRLMRNFLVKMVKSEDSDHVQNAKEVLEGLVE
ncbi:SRPBCC family protein [Niallia sp.]|uniref:SRPBCC family protein n=1 Tax=Niallia sp. TaxID=2837523 RepID=UPI00289E40B8|nr:SRPBCC family protein [Niallia sp.]